MEGEKTGEDYLITTKSGKTFKAKQLIFASGIKDILPNIKGFEACWGKTIIHCPYCHGYEVRNEVTGILANGKTAFHYAKLISNWTKELSIFTNGPSTLTDEEARQIEKHQIKVIEKEITQLEHQDGVLRQLVFKDQTAFQLKAIYTRPASEQHCKIPEQLGCELTEHGLIKVDPFQKASLANIFCCGDNSSPLRAVSHAIATGTIAGAMANNERIEMEF